MAQQYKVTCFWRFVGLFAAIYALLTLMYFFLDFGRFLVAACYVAGGALIVLGVAKLLRKHAFSDAAVRYGLFARSAGGWIRLYPYCEIAAGLALCGVLIPCSSCRTAYLAWWMLGFSFAALVLGCIGMVRSIRALSAQVRSSCPGFLHMVRVPAVWDAFSLYSIVILSAGCVFMCIVSIFLGMTVAHLIF